MSGVIDPAGAGGAIETARLILRRRVSGDAVALYPALADPVVMRWWSRPPFPSVAALREDFGRREADGWRAWAICRRGEDRAIGFVSAGEKRPGVSEIGYLVDPRAQRQGFAREALAGLIERLMAEGQRRIFADVDPDNAGSIAVLERLGFTLEGRLRQEWRTHIGIRDTLIYALLADDYAGQADAAPPL